VSRKRYVSGTTEIWAHQSRGAALFAVVARRMRSAHYCAAVSRVECKLQLLDENVCSFVFVSITQKVQRPTAPSVLCHQRIIRCNECQNFGRSLDLIIVPRSHDLFPLWHRSCVRRPSRLGTPSPCGGFSFPRVHSWSSRPMDFGRRGGGSSFSGTGG